MYWVSKCAGCVEDHRGLGCSNGEVEVKDGVRRNKLGKVSVTEMIKSLCVETYSRHVYLIYDGETFVI